MAVPAVVGELIERFTEQQEDYRFGRYNETQLRRDFLDPFFTALGWDVDNRKGWAEAYREVIHEDAIKVGGRTKAPDYCFRAGGGVRNFFVEAKKPSVDIREAVSPAYQLRRYAWSAKLPVSILTDFEEFAVYDCRVRPAKTDKASTARVLYRKYTEYVDCWDELVGLFSPEAIRRGALDKFISSKKIKKGTAEVDAAFLDEIESWRDVLARNIALRNPEISQRDVNFAVGRTIDRVIFLRICEDRGIEPYGTLGGLVNGTSVYRRLGELFQKADQRYNSGLFHFTPEKDRGEPDELTLDLTIDDKPLGAILKQLYYPDSPYEFSVLPADILGQIYEQFLGKVIRLTKGHRAVVEDKPEVKKAGGVYYTPTYIVDYIVRHTVGRLLGGAGDEPCLAAAGTAATGKKRITPAQVEKLRILDPACGSGSFLIGAYQYLLDWHRNWYVENDTEKHARGRGPKIHRARGGDWRLTTAERKRILLNNIHGVDIDPQAVEVTKLSLLLKVLEGESQETIQNQQRLFRERALPDLSRNIKCGNSLIAPDFYGDRQMSLLDEEEMYRINVFDWQAEFPDIFKRKNPGFDAVIGNPPYIRMEEFKSIKPYLRANYAVHEERSDIYAYFVEKAHQLLRPDGVFGMILSNKFIKAKYGLPLRGFLFSGAQVERLADFAGRRVFQGATVRTVILVTRRVPAPARGQMGSTNYLPPPDLDTFEKLQGGCISLTEAEAGGSVLLPPGSLRPERWLLVGDGEQKVLKKLHTCGTPLREFVDDRVLWGVKTGLNDAFVIDAETRARILQADPRSDEIIKPFLFGEDVRRFHVEFKDRYLIYTYHGIDISVYPGVRDHLRAFKSRLQGRATKQVWYELQQPSVALVPIFERAKIVYPEIARFCQFTLDTDGYFSNNKTFILPTDDVFILGVLNSSAAFFYFSRYCAALEGPKDRYLEFRAQYLRDFPIPTIGPDEATRERRGRIVELVEQMLSLHKRLASAARPHQKTVLERQIAATDQQIDRLVYELYELTDEEIKIVEEATKGE